MSKVYFRPIDSYSHTAEISGAGADLLAKVLDDGKVRLPKEVGLKVHFGEKGNTTYIRPKNYVGIIKELRRRGHEPFYTETNVLYRGERTTRDRHIRLAKEHGFTQIPVKIADGRHGDEYELVKIDGKHFKECRIGRGIAKADGLVYIAHFKGHMLAGFGGALKQLAMGSAARGGKLAQHADAKPWLNPFTCKKCSSCVQECPEDAIRIGAWSKIDKGRCVGCAACIAVCPNGVIKMNVLSASVSKKFHEKLAEYAFAAQKGKSNAYVNFVFNVTRGCDCMGSTMRPVGPDIGVFASADPVALDMACLDALDRAGGKRFRGRHSLEYAERLGLGCREYELVEL